MTVIDRAHAVVYVFSPTSTSAERMKSNVTIGLVLVVLACGGGSSSPAPSGANSTPEAAVRNFMQAVADSNITRMSELWGTANGPASETKKPDDYERRMIITQVYLRKVPYQIVRTDPITGDDKRRLVTVTLDRGQCVKSVPFTVVNVGKEWIVNQIDLNQAGQPVRPCQSPSTTSP
jgi:hypothetical protein